MKKWMIGGGILGALALALVGSLVIVPVFAQGPIPAAQSETQADAGPNEQSPAYDSSVRVDEAQYEGMSEADEAAALSVLATITPEDAKAKALLANPGAAAVQVELDNENGALVYSVELDNGLDVKVDAVTGTILYTEQADADEAGAVDTDNVQEELQEEFGSQADDATEATGIEDGPGQ